MATHTSNQRVRLTRDLLKKKLILLLQSKSISAVKVKELCEKAELNRTTFYLHYGSPQDVLKDIEADFLNSTKDVLAEISPSFNDIQYITAYLNFVHENADVFRILILDPQDKEFQKSFLDMMFNITQKQFAPTVPKQIQAETYAFILQGDIAIIKTWMDSGFQKSAQEIAELIYDLSDSALVAVERL